MKRAALLFLLASAPALAAEAPAPFALRDGDRVVFYGDSITQDGAYARFVEEYVRTRFPRWDIRFYNAGVGGDTVRGGGAGPIDVRLERDVIAHKPTVVTIMLGMNDGGYKPFDPMTLATFGEGYRAIVAKLQQALPGVRLTFIRSSPFDDVARPAAVPPRLRRHAAPARLLRHDPGREGEGHGRGLPRPGERRDRRGPRGQSRPRAPGRSRSRAPGPRRPPGDGRDAAARLERAGPRGPRRDRRRHEDGGRGRERRGERARGDGEPASRGPSSIARCRFPLAFEDGETELAERAGAGIEGLDQQTLVVTGLAAGRHELKIDGQSVGTFADADLAKGVNLARYRTPMRWQAYSVKWSVGSGHEAQRLRRDMLAGGAKDPSLQAAADTLAARDEAAQRQRSVDATPKPRRYELAPVR